MQSKRFMHILMSEDLDISLFFMSVMETMWKSNRFKIIIHDFITASSPGAMLGRKNRERNGASHCFLLPSLPMLIAPGDNADVLTKSTHY